MQQKIIKNENLNVEDIYAKNIEVHYLTIEDYIILCLNIIVRNRDIKIDKLSKRNFMYH